MVMKFGPMKYKKTLGSPGYCHLFRNEFASCNCSSYEIRSFVYR